MSRIDAECFVLRDDIVPSAHELGLATARGPAPSVAKPDLRQNMDLRGFGSAIMECDA
jgi:hypothetical protein